MQAFWHNHFAVEEQLNYDAQDKQAEFPPNYVAGRRTMETIEREFRPGGRLHAALDGSTPFRHPEQWRTVRGRAWAVHDGILDVVNLNWDGVRMSKRLGRHAAADTFPDGEY